ncbi:hypothetical protein ACJX0J_022870, partial [Zea mays]
SLYAILFFLEKHENPLINGVAKLALNMIDILPYCLDMQRLKPIGFLLRNKAETALETTSTNSRERSVRGHIFGFAYKTM